MHSPSILIVIIVTVVIIQNTKLDRAATCVSALIRRRNDQRGYVGLDFKDAILEIELQLAFLMILATELDDLAVRDLHWKLFKASEIERIRQARGV